MAEPTMFATYTEMINISQSFGGQNGSDETWPLSTEGLDNGTRTVNSKGVVSSIIMFSAGVLGNCIALTLMATAQSEKRQTMFYKLMAGLVCTDLIGTCATSPVVIMIYVTGKEMQEGTALCEYFSFVMVLAGFSTMSIICAMSIERYICICHPYIYQCKMPKSYPKFALGFAWLFSMLIASLPLIGIGHNVVQFPNTWCFFDSVSRDTSDAVFSYVYVIIGFLDIIVTFYCNISTIITVFTSRRRQRALSACQGQAVRSNRGMTQRIAEMHMIAMNFGVTIVFTACYGPLMMCTLLFRTNLVYQMNTRKAYLLMVRIASFNQIFDPLVYILVRRDLRWKIISFFKVIFGGGHPEPVKRSSVGYIDQVSENQGVSSVYASTRSVNKSPEIGLESDAPIRSFCYHCLCDPPTYSNTRTSTCRGYSVKSAMPPSKVASSESLLNYSEKCIIRQPSRQEQVELKAIINQNGTKV